MQRIVLLSSLPWWELGTNSLITGPGEWLSFRRFTSKLSWSWSWSASSKHITVSDCQTITDCLHNDIQVHVHTLMYLYDTMMEWKIQNDNLKPVWDSCVLFHFLGPNSGLCLVWTSLAEEMNPWLTQHRNNLRRKVSFKTWAVSFDNLLMPNANKKSADQPTYSCSLISTCHSLAWQ